MKGQEEKWDWNPNLHLSLLLPKGGLFWFVFLFPTQSTCKVYFKIEFLEDSNRFKPRSLEETSTLTLVAMMTPVSPFILWHGGSSWCDNPVLVLDVHFQSSPALVVGSMACFPLQQQWQYHSHTILENTGKPLATRTVPRFPWHKQEVRLSRGQAHKGVFVVHLRAQGPQSWVGVN